MFPFGGKIPDWLDGTSVRNGPRQFELNHAELDQCYDLDKRVCYVHRFDGLAMPRGACFVRQPLSDHGSLWPRQPDRDRQPAHERD